MRTAYPAQSRLSRSVCAAVERLFSHVGIAFAANRKNADADTLELLEDIMFSRYNLP